MPNRINRPDHKTLSSATAEAIHDAIKAGTFPPGSQLPPEFELIEMLGVSRTTLREALKSLEIQRYIVRKRGLGTFVNDQAIEKDLSLNFGISEMIIQAGYKPGAIHSSVQITEADSKIAHALDLPEGEPVLVLDRVRTANQKPVVWSVDILPATIFNNQIPDDFHPEKISLYSYIQEKLHLRILHGEAKILPELATPSIASKLNIMPNDPILLISQIDIGDNEHPILYTTEYHLPDMFVFFIQRKGPSW